ncbi:MAG: ATP-binding cassette domain-containing protein, partial [Lachnospiraceae bacterium]|nr:ATP-binding cassette domain-containing protein [Lachnospiraceae bacterium]
MQEILQVSNLRKTFKLSKKQQKLMNADKALIVAVDGVSFSSYKGEVFGLLGPNGAGKTTVMRMLATLINPDAGDAMVGGYSIVKQQQEVRQSIGFLTNELKLDGFFTPNYFYDFYSELYGIPKVKAK